MSDKNVSELADALNLPLDEINEEFTEIEKMEVLESLVNAN